MIASRPNRRMLLAAALLGGLSAPAALPALAQAPLLYEQRLPDGTAFIRFINTLPGEVTVKSDIAPTFTQAATDADRVGPYVPAEKATGREVVLDITAEGQSTQARVTFKEGYNTVILARQDGKVAAVNLADGLEFNQLRARLAFYNVIQGCADGSLTLQGSNQAVFTGVAPNTTKSRSVNPTAASVRATCGGKPAPVQDLGKLEAGGQYSVWLMAPAGTPVTLLARDRIAARR
jgi:hypothetical protein